MTIKHPEDFVGLPEPRPEPHPEAEKILLAGKRLTYVIGFSRLYHPYDWPQVWTEAAEMLKAEAEQEREKERPCDEVAALLDFVRTNWLEPWLENNRAVAKILGREDFPR